MPDFITIGIIAGGLTTLIASAPILLGFGTAGVAAGSVAAGVQSSIGLVKAGSLFASLTSLGMKGIFAKVAISGASTTILATVGNLFS